MPNVPRYGPFLREWSLIYERFGVPAEIGLSQAILESGLNGTADRARTRWGLCQWLRRNWQFLDSLSPAVIEAYNQTTQAPYCAAYLSILATMYGSFIPALSEHHSGRRERGPRGDQRRAPGRRHRQRAVSSWVEVRPRFAGRGSAGYRDLYRTYGPRSFRYAEMVFGNTST